MSRRRRLLWACCVAVIAGALRLPALANRPMHADEAILADKLGMLLAGQSYVYDPTEYHGPMLGLISTIPAYLSGRSSYLELTEPLLRAVPAVAGILLALSPLLLAGCIGEVGAVIAALFIAVSPSSVFYSRYYIPEMLLALFTAGILVSLWKASQTGSPVWWASAGAFAAAALASKETAAVALIALAVPFALIIRPKMSAGLFFCFMFVLAALISPLDMAQGLSSWFQRGVEGSIHAQPPLYYFGLLGRETIILALAAGALFLPARSFVQVLKWYLILLVGIYSVLSYKTPWCVVSMIYAAALLAGAAASWLIVKQLWIGTAVILLGASHLAWQTADAAFVHPADPRNPWVYAQTGPDVFRIRDVIERYASASDHGRNLKISVYTRENLWPLPWYLRPFPNVGWSREVPVEGPPSPLVLITPEMEPRLQRKIYEGPPAGERELYMNAFADAMYLRPGVEVRGYVRKSLWDAAQ